MHWASTCVPSSTRNIKGEVHHQYVFNAFLRLLHQPLHVLEADFIGFKLFMRNVIYIIPEHSRALGDSSASELPTHPERLLFGIKADQIIALRVE